MMRRSEPNTSGYQFVRIRSGTVVSTQDEARALVRAGARTGTIVIADEQTSGRGRDGHSWDSPHRLGLWMTLVHRSRRPVHEWPVFTSAGALAVCFALEEAGLAPAIRWPNDIMIMGRKICGILAETEADALLLGIGLNVLQAVSDFPSDLREIATSIAIEMHRSGHDAPGIDDLLDAILGSLGTILRDMESAGPAEIVAKVWHRSLVRGRRVEVQMSGAGGMIQGETVGLSAIGGLIVRGPKGPVEIVSGRLLGIREEES